VYPPTYTNWGGQKFFSLASLANSLFCTPHYGTRGAAPARPSTLTSTRVLANTGSTLIQAANDK